MMPTIEEALAYMGIDYADAVVTANANRALAAAVRYIHGSVGEELETYLPNDARVSELVLIYTDDFYSNRGGDSAKLSNATRRLVTSTELQLRLELQRKKEAASV